MQTMYNAHRKPILLKVMSVDRGLHNGQNIPQLHLSEKSPTQVTRIISFAPQSQILSV